EIIDRISQIARHHRTADESRTMDQLRADIAADLLAGTTDPTIGKVHLTVDLTALFDPDTAKAAELAGYGPVLTDITTQARTQFEQAGWDWTVHLPATGAPVADGHTRRRPTASQQRRLRARYRTCIAPGCRRPAISSDIDHTRPWADTGITDSQQLGPLCRPDHCTRHQSGWNYEFLPDHTISWTSPLGTTYTVTGADPP
ncbi:MAG: HNH endonuclease signature motif containing protein, partial [Acidimicrobiia bacterium]